MTRSLRALAAAFAVSAVGAAPAAAKVVEIGPTPGVTAHASCPQTCCVVTRTSGLQTEVSGMSNPYVVQSNGRIVAFTVDLGDPPTSYIKGSTNAAGFDQTYGGPASMRIIVLRRDKKLWIRGVGYYKKVVASSGTYPLATFFGTVSQFALHESIPVRAGDYVGVTVPTWAPILAVNLGSKEGWRASRPKGQCGDEQHPEYFINQTSLMKTGAGAFFRCHFTTARLTFSVTEVTDPQPKYDPNHKPIRR